jgi:ComF family protein
MSLLKSILADAIHLFYPHVCMGCGSDLLDEPQLLCLKCLHDLPHTHFESFTNNPVEKYFWGRLPLEAAHSEFYFSKGTLIQYLVHQLKYKNNKAIGVYLGEITGKSLLKSNRFNNIDALVPLPLNADKEHKRGYNQAAIICNGISAVMQIPVINGNVIRNRFTDTQTRKHRTERWENVEGSFIVSDPATLQGKHVLLVDDVVTTGATLEACGRVMQQQADIKLSIATLAHAAK